MSVNFRMQSPFNKGSVCALKLFSATFLIHFFCKFSIFFIHFFFAKRFKRWKWLNNKVYNTREAPWMVNIF